MAWGIGPGDAVFCPSFTFAATAEVLPWFGATPVFVDVLPDTYNIDPASLEAAIAGIKREGKLKPRAVIAVDLFGQPADYPKIAEICRREGLKLIADSAQGFGCTLNNRIRCIGPTRPRQASFRPSRSAATATAAPRSATATKTSPPCARSRCTARGGDKYDNVRIGMNSRLDTMQAAILLEKLAIFADEIAARNIVAERYRAMLSNLVRTPSVIAGGVSTWAQYTIEAEDRDGLAAHLRNDGIPTAQYYPKPLHQQSAYRAFPVGAGGMKVSDDIAGRVLSLPMHPYLDEATQAKIAASVRAFVSAGG